MLPALEKSMITRRSSLPALTAEAAAGSPGARDQLRPNEQLFCRRAIAD
jgi:hypothetical protein